MKKLLEFNKKLCKPYDRMKEQEIQHRIEEVGDVVEKQALDMGWTIEELLEAILHRHILIAHK